MKNIVVRLATEQDSLFAETITNEMEASAKLRGSGISKRSPASIIKKMTEGMAVLAITDRNEWVGFSYIEVWAQGEFVSNSGLIVTPEYRGQGVAKAIKEKIFELSKELFPQAKIFSITTGLAIMKMNAGLGFEPVTFNELPHDRKFWNGCKSCINFDILTGKHFKNCLCTAMLHQPSLKRTKNKRVA